MRKLIVFNLITLDGFFEGPNQDISWHNVDGEFNDFSIQQLRSMGTILFGRVTYQMMASYWPAPQALRDDPIVAELMNNTPKVVFSHTLQQADWHNTTLVKGEASDAIRKLKQQPGGDMFIFGSGGLVSSIAPHDLIDEYRLIVNPVFLGSGVLMLRGLNERQHLKLLRTQTFQSGNVLLCYQPIGKDVHHGVS